MSNDDVLATLNPTAAGVARAFLAAHPDATLTSGKRSVQDQARAMAENVAQNSAWIQETYLVSDLSTALQNHVWALAPGDRTQQSLQDGFTAILLLATPDELRHLSFHLAGDAFDVAPDGDQSKLDTLGQLLATAVASGAGGKLLTREGGLTRWHMQIA
jgi:hypothetical protein